ncbi:MAG TPA: hypothetical protein VMP11_01075 [Verrucomicrobiae bacterium]|nr:hypothetical protein [Verrucomicrobiae bacterium]
MAYSNDADKLLLLSIFHYIIGGFAALSSVLALPFLVLACPAALVSKQVGQGALAPRFGSIFLLIGCAILLLIGTCAALLITAGRSLATHKRYTFCLIIAVLELFFFPFGTILGLITLIVLTRQSTQQLFHPTTP